MIEKIFLLLFVTVYATQQFMTMTGGVTDMDVGEFKNNTLGLSALNFAVADHNKRSNDMFHYGVSKVVRVQRQVMQGVTHAPPLYRNMSRDIDRVVAGMKYIITVDMAKTTCRKSAREQTCLNQSVSGNPPVQQCRFDLWLRPWLNNSIILQKENCTRTQNNVGTVNTDVVF